MPQSSDQMRKLMRLMFGGNDAIVDVDQPMAFLQKAGYVLRSDWTWKPPSPDHYVDIMEELCIRYLIEEWDYGSLVEDPPQGVVAVQSNAIEEMCGPFAAHLKVFGCPNTTHLHLIAYGPNDEVLSNCTFTREMLGEWEKLIEAHERGGLPRPPETLQ